MTAFVVTLVTLLAFVLLRRSLDLWLDGKKMRAMALVVPAVAAVAAVVVALAVGLL